MFARLHRDYLAEACVGEGRREVVFGARGTIAPHSCMNVCHILIIITSGFKFLKP